MFHPYCYSHRSAFSVSFHYIRVFDKVKHRFIYGCETIVSEFFSLTKKKFGNSQIQIIVVQIWSNPNQINNYFLVFEKNHFWEYKVKIFIKLCDVRIIF